MKNTHIKSQALFNAMLALAVMNTINGWVERFLRVFRSGYDQLSAEPYFEELNAFYLQWRQELRMDFDFKVHVDIDGPIANSENLVSDAI